MLLAHVIARATRRLDDDGYLEHLADKPCERAAAAQLRHRVLAALDHDDDPALRAATVAKLGVRH